MTNSLLSFALILPLITAVVTAPEAKAQSGSTETTSGFPLLESPPAGLEGIYTSYEQGFGFVPNLAKVMSHSPALMHSYDDVQKSIKTHSTLSPSEINIAQMAIAVENKCRYCTAGHTMAGQAFYKTPAEHMRAVREQKILSDPKIEALRNFAVAVYETHGHPEQKTIDAFYEAGYTQAQSLDVVACIAAKVMTNYANALGGTPLDEPLKPLAFGLTY